MPSPAPRISGSFGPPLGRRPKKRRRKPRAGFYPWFWSLEDGLLQRSTSGLRRTSRKLELSAGRNVTQFMSSVRGREGGFGWAKAKPAKCSLTWCYLVELPSEARTAPGHGLRRPGQKGTGSL